MHWSDITTFAGALFTITNPVGNAALFLGMVSDEPPARQRWTAITAAVAAAAIMVSVVWLGEAMLTFFGVSIAALETAGGLIIAIIGLSMLHAKASAIHTNESEQEEAKGAHSVAIVPLAMPIVAGPGTISTVLVNSHKYQGLENNLLLTGICIAAAALVGVCFALAEPLSRRLGSTGINILTRFMGMILTAIAIGMLATGLKALLPGLAG